MKIAALRSPYEKVGGIYHFGRMLDKIRLHAQGKLPADYQANLGGGFDARCLIFLQLDYESLVERVKNGGTDDEIFEWCYERGRHPTDDEITVWNEFMRKRGWRDDLSQRLVERKREAGIADREDIQTFFDFIDVDEGREPGEKPQR